MGFFLPKIKTFPRRRNETEFSVSIRLIGESGIVDSKKHTCEGHKTEHFNLDHPLTNPKASFPISQALSHVHGKWQKIIHDTILATCVTQIGWETFKDCFNEVNAWDISLDEANTQTALFFALNTSRSEKRRREWKSSLKRSLWIVIKKRKQYSQDAHLNCLA